MLLCTHQVHHSSVHSSERSISAPDTNLSPISSLLITPKTDSVRVMTLNLWYKSDQRAERHIVAGRLAAALNVDVLLVQEVQEVPSDSVEQTLNVIGKTSGLTLAATSPEVSATSSHPPVAVFSRLPFQTHEPVKYSSIAMPSQYAALASVRTRVNRDLLVVSAHLSWGGKGEYTRLRQVVTLDQEISRILGNEMAPACLGGDLNSLPQSSTIRYLTGLDSYEGESTQWADAFALAGIGDGVTSTSANPWARVTAERHGFLDTYALPDRRIDYIMVRGYPYGRPFAPQIAFSVSTDMLHALLPDAADPPSDHNAVVCDLWDPPLDYVQSSKDR